MKMRLLAPAFLLAFAVNVFSQQAPTTLAPTPPMGWNSWDAYGTTIDETSFRANADYLAAHLKPFGYQYATIDEAWFDAAPAADGGKTDSIRFMDAYGRFIPAPARYPSSAGANGFAPLAASLHAKGLKFGIHILNGIPKEAVARNLPIEGSPFHAQDAALPSSHCAWNADNVDLLPGEAAQAYYDSIVRLYASWGVDLIKIDCIASHPYKADEVRMFHAAIAKAGRPIVVSLSPGEAPLDQAANLRVYAQQWRISDDVWDLWNSTSFYPQGVNDQFERATRWNPEEAPGHWPDLDMIPVGHLGPAPGWGKARDTHLTHDEQRTLFNLWSIARSPLVLGADLVSLGTQHDDWTLSLITNGEVLEVDQHSRQNHSVSLTPQLAVWTAAAAAGPDRYLAVFNRQDTPQTVHLAWKDLGLSAASYRERDLWSHTTGAPQPGFSVTLAPHASTMLRLIAAP